MQTLTLKTGTNFNNLTFDFNKVKSIKMAVDNPSAPKIWILYFYGQFRNDKEYVIKIWFFYKETDLYSKLNPILKQYPHIRVR